MPGHTGPVNVFNVLTHERHCSNCSLETNCYRAYDETNPMAIPMEFGLRDSWTIPQYNCYIKRIFGGICERFINRHVTIPASGMFWQDLADRNFHLTPEQIEKILDNSKESEDKGWDK